MWHYSFLLLSGLLAGSSAVSIPAHSHIQFRDTPPSCSGPVTNDFHWTIEDFTYHASYIFTTPAHQNSWGYVDFNLTNPALPYAAKCSAASNQLSDFFYGNYLYTCTLPDGSTISDGSASFEFSRPSGQLNINQTWTCIDTDPTYPVTYGATGTVNLALTCNETFWQNPDWTVGQIYSTRGIICDPVTLPLVPSAMTAIA